MLSCIQSNIQDHQDKIRVCLIHPSMRSRMKTNSIVIQKLKLS